MTKTIKEMIEELKAWYPVAFPSANVDTMKPWELREHIINMGIREIHAQMEMEISYNKMVDGYRELYEAMELGRDADDDGYYDEYGYDKN